MKIRARFAPSPTGYLHIGGLRTALYNYLFARKNGGDFLLRLEDTDRTRYVEGAAENLIKSLADCNLSWDEGVILDDEGNLAEKGDFGPYMQSKRLDIYKKYVDELLASGKAYYCFCSSERLGTLREEQMAHSLPPKYDKHCVNLSKEEITSKLAAGEPYVVRLNVPENEIVEFDDLIRGNIKINSNDVDDQVLLKSDGFPTYHMANIVDDHLMEISHVIRGEEWISSTPKHVLLYKAFGWEVPAYAHLPLLLNPDKSKLSKRQGDVAVEDYLKKGYLPEALINFVALLGWNPGDDREMFSLKELEQEFSLERCGKSGSVFDQEKLKWMNGLYIRQLSDEALWEAVKPYLMDHLALYFADFMDEEEFLRKIVKIQQGRLNILSDIQEAIDFFFIPADQLTYSGDLLIWKKSDSDDAREKLKLVQDFLENYTGDWGVQALNDSIIDWIKSNGFGVGDVLWPLRVALSGEKDSPSPFELLWAFGKEKSLERIFVAINKLV